MQTRENLIFACIYLIIKSYYLVILSTQPILQIVFSSRIGDGSYYKCTNELRLGIRQRGESVHKHIIFIALNSVLYKSIFFQGR